MKQARPSAKTPTGVLVLGMHRSGTSATAAALQERGFALGDDLVPAAADNPEGYFEHAVAVRIDDELLGALDRSWQDLRALPEKWLSSDAAREAAQALGKEMLPFFAAHRPWVLKDPRLCRVLPLWRRELEKAGERPACLLVLRHPAEVAASLGRRDHMPAELAHVLWLRHVLEAFEHSKGLPRTVLDYASLLSDGGPLLDAALARLGFDAPTKATRLASLRPGLRHNVAKRTGGGGEWAALATEAYEALLAGPEQPGLIEALKARFAEGWRGAALDLAELGEWLGQGAHRHRSAREHGIAQERRADALQARVDATDQTLAEEQRRSRERLALAESLQEELSATQQAFDGEAKRSLARQAEAEKLQSELSATQNALQEEARRSLARQAEAEKLQA